MSLKDRVSERKEKTEAKKRKSLVDEIYVAGMLPNLSTGLISILYVVITAKIPADKIIPVMFIAFCVSVFLQFVIAPFSNKFITQNASDDLDSFHNYGSDTKERTRLMKELMALPEKVGFQIFVVFYMGIAIWALLCQAILKLDSTCITMFFCSGFFGAYTGLVFGVVKTQKVCSKHTCDVVAKGVLKEEVNQKHSFGTSSTKITVIHIFGPIFVIFIFYAILAYRLVADYVPFSQMVVRLGFVTLVNVIYYSVLSSMLFGRMMVSIKELRDIMESLDRTNLTTVQPHPTDLSNEFMYNIYLINGIISTLQEILNLSQKISGDVIASSNELSILSKQTAATSLEQATGIKELLSAMEESDRLAKNIASKICEVSDLAKVTTEDIDKGFDILKDSMVKLDEIQRANQITDDGILALSDKIKGISDIATIINSIADQTNIIAFNAELEASSAGEAGENFHLVANEIRRLTNNTIQSTNEIQTKIVEIQHSSQELLSSSRNGRVAIDSGNKMVSKLNDNFEQLRETSSVTADSAEEIKKIVQEQTSSFDQIVVTLNQIHTAAESFSVSTQNISQSAENLCTVSDELKRLQLEDICEEHEHQEEINE